jgi:tetratricopeptide (TPR) repeat protein
MRSPFKTLLLTIILVSLALTSVAEDEYWSVQAGTYALSAIKFAGKQYDVLSKELSESSRAYLRIEKGTKYYIIRIGRIEDRAEAIALLREIKKLVPDAFVLRRGNMDGLMIVRQYEMPKPKYKAPKPVLEEYYTLQIGTYEEKEKAKEEFDSLTRTLMEDKLSDLRIEGAGDHFSVRLGRFENYSRARDFQRGEGDELAEAIIMKAFVRDEQIMALYGEKHFDDVIEVDGSELSAHDLSENSEHVLENASANPEPIDAIIDEVAAYYNEDDFGNAAELLRKGLAKWPDNSDLHAWYGATLLNMRFPEQAYEQYSKAVEIAPDVPDYHAGLGFSLLDIYMDKARNSIEAFKQALEIDPDNVSALEGLGIVYVSIDKKDLAAEIYDQLRDLDGDAADRLEQIIAQGLEWEEE